MDKQNEILKLHYAGKKHSTIIREMEKRGTRITRRDIEKAILEGMKPITDLPNAVDFTFLRNEKPGQRIK